jgi:hypothetical protein
VWSPRCCGRCGERRLNDCRRRGGMRARLRRALAALPPARTPRGATRGALGRVAAVRRLAHKTCTRASHQLRAGAALAAHGSGAATSRRRVCAVSSAPRAVRTAARAAQRRSAHAALATPCWRTARWRRAGTAPPGGRQGASTAPARC